APLANLKALDALDVSSNLVSTVEPLAALPVLRWLSLDGNRVVDLAPLGGDLDLRYLYVANNKICAVPASVVALKDEHSNSAGDWIALEIDGEADQDRGDCAKTANP